MRSHHLAAVIDEPMADRPQHWRARAESLTAREIMTTHVVTCTATETIAIVVRRLLRHNVRLPVVEDRCLVGVLSRHDILGLFDRSDEEIKSGVRELLSNRIPSRASASRARGATRQATLGTFVTPADHGLHKPRGPT